MQIANRTATEFNVPAYDEGLHIIDTVRVAHYEIWLASSELPGVVFKLNAAEIDLLADALALYRKVNP